MSTISVDLLTAYALGEASPADQAVVEAHLTFSPADRAEVEAIRAAAALLSSSLADETSPGLDRQRRQALAALPAVSTAPRRILFPHRIVWPSVLAACLVIGVVSLSQPVTPTNSPSAAPAMLALKKEDAPSPVMLRDNAPARAAPTAVAAKPAEEPLVAMQPAAEQVAAPAAADLPAPASAAEPLLAMADRQRDANVAKGVRNEAEAVVAERLDEKPPAAPAPAAVGVMASDDGALNEADSRATIAAAPAQTAGAAMALGASAPGATDSVAALRAHLAAGHWPPPASVETDLLLAVFVPPVAEAKRNKGAATVIDDGRQRFAAAVIEFAEVLRGTPGRSLQHVLQVAEATTAGRPERVDFLTVVRQAQRIQAQPPAAAAAPAADIDHQ